MSEIYAARQQEQYRRDQARLAASRLYPDVKVSPSAHVQLVEEGAFVEIQVWVPNVEIGKEDE